MNIVNKTNTPIYYGTQSPGSCDCGKIEPHEKTYIPYDEKCGTFSVSLNPACEPPYFELNNVKPGAIITITLSVD